MKTNTIAKKKTYITPVLTIRGSVQNLTMAAGSVAADVEGGATVGPPFG